MAVLDVRLEDDCLGARKQREELHGLSGQLHNLTKKERGGGFFLSQQLLCFVIFYFFVQPFRRRSKFSVLPLQLAGKAETWFAAGMVWLVHGQRFFPAALDCPLWLRLQMSCLARRKGAWCQIIGWDSFAPSVVQCRSCDRLCDVLSFWSI